MKIRFLRTLEKYDTFIYPFDGQTYMIVANYKNRYLCRRFNSLKCRVVWGYLPVFCVIF